MTAQAWTAIIAGVGLVASIVSALMVTGYRIGKLEGELRTANSSALQVIGDRLTRIEAMFELRLKD